MLNEWQFQHLKTIRRIPQKRSAITLERIVGERKLLERANEGQQLVLYGYFKHTKRGKRENKMVADTGHGNARGTTQRTRGSVGPATIRVPRIEPGIEAQLRDHERQSRERAGVLSGNASTISGRALSEWFDRYRLYQDEFDIGGNP